RSSALASIASANFSRARLRSAGVASRQVSNAPAAARSAASTSAGPETGAVAYAWPVLGSTTSLTASLTASANCPFTKFRSAVLFCTAVTVGLQSFAPELRLWHVAGRYTSDSALIWRNHDEIG